MSSQFLLPFKVKRMTVMSLRMPPYHVISRERIRVTRSHLFYFEETIVKVTAYSVVAIPVTDTVESKCDRMVRVYINRN